MLSLTASYDDLLRNAKVLMVSVEPEFKTFVENQQVCRRHWSTSELQVREMRSKITSLETENAALQARLTAARSLIEREEEKRLRVEQDKELLEQRICQIRELLMDQKRSKLDDQDRERLAFLSTYQKSVYEESPEKRPNNNTQHSVISDDDIDYWDVTGEELDPVCGRRRRSQRLRKKESTRRKEPSAPREEDLTPPKRPKTGISEENTVVTTTTITVTADGRPVEASTEVQVPAGKKKSLNKSFSEPALDRHMIGGSETDSDWGTPTNQNNNRAGRRSPMTTPLTPAIRRVHSARMHAFISETVIRPRTCVPCGKRIGFGRLAMKCRDCKSMCHPECKDNLPLPCIQAPATPGPVGGDLQSYCSNETPKIPGIVELHSEDKMACEKCRSNLALQLPWSKGLTLIHCVNEVEARGMDQEGIYRISGELSKVKELKEKFFRGKGMPNLASIPDIHVVCGCLKDFLRGLKEPLITFGLWKDFVKAAQNRDRAMSESELYQALSELPEANKDTLAFLMLHLLRVSQTPETKMGVGNLITVFGPSIVGHSTAELEPMQTINETKYQAMVMDKLFEVSEDYWVKFISDEPENIYNNQYNTPNTPDLTKGMLQSRLGPVHTPGSYDRSQTWTTRNTFTPRRGERTQNITRRGFFNSPTVE